MSSSRPFALMILVLFAAAAVVMPWQAARADTGPKPTMEFEFVYEISPAPAIVSGIQYECSQPDCSDATPLMEAGPQRFGCSEGGCSSLAYGYSDYHRLSIEFSDGVRRQSNIFGKRYFDAVYTVTVRQSDLLVEEGQGGGTPLNPILTIAVLLCAAGLAMAALAVLLIIVVVRAGDFRGAKVLYILSWLASLIALALSVFFPSALAGLLVTLAVEMILALAYALWRRRSLTLVLTIVWLMNLFTRPFLSFASGQFGLTISGSLIWTLGLEIVVWLVEAVLLGVALRKQAKFWEGLLLSLVLNAASFGLGLLVPF